MQWMGGVGGSFSVLCLSGWVVTGGVGWGATPVLTVFGHRSVFAEGGCCKNCIVWT